MASTELQKKGNMTIAGMLAAAAGGVASFIFLSGIPMWIIGIGLFVFAGSLFPKVLKNFAETGRRF